MFGIDEGDDDDDDAGGSGDGNARDGDGREWGMVGVCLKVERWIWFARGASGRKNWWWWWWWWCVLLDGQTVGIVAVRYDTLLPWEGWKGGERRLKLQ